MCRQCDDPTTTDDEALERMARVVHAHGWAIQYVEGDGVHPPWAYTIGLACRGLPELVITGLTDDVVGPLLNAEACAALVEGVPPAGERVVLTHGGDAEVVDVPHPDAHLHVARALYGDQAFAAAQLVWADHRGRWPWQPAFRGGPGGQPVLGPRTASGPAQDSPASL